MMISFSISLRSLVTLTFLILGLKSTQAQICAPFAPDLPISGPLAESQAIAIARQNMTATLEQLIGTYTIDTNETSFSLDFYSLHDGGSLFTYHYSAPTLHSATEGVTAVDSNTIYRVGSISKVFTVYTYLANIGDLSWNHPITRYVAELAEAAASTEDDSAVDVVRWEDVTIGALASQLAGILRDVSGSAAYDELQMTALGLPPVSAPNGSYCEGIPGFELPCDRASFFENILARHPVVAPFHSPTYSNLAFQVLAYALENITSTPFDELVNSTLADLPLNSTYFALPPSSDNAVIPSNATVSWYNADIGPISPGGSYYSTINDLREFGLSILNFTVLSPALTRRWLKPHSFTPDSYITVGAPWEIVSFPFTDRFATKVYAKSGSLGSYNSEMGLIPDYNVGFTVLAAGPLSAAASSVLSNAVVSAFLPAVQATAREQTALLYAGFYEDGATNSSLALSIVDDLGGRSNLHIDSWVWNGTDMIDILALSFGLNSTLLAIDVSLFPTGLSGPGPDGTRVVSWRGTYQIGAPEDSSEADPTASPSSSPLYGPFTLGCNGWAAVDGLTYGGRSFDEISFQVDSQTGEALSVTAAVLQQGAWEKVSSGSVNVRDGGTKVKLKRDDFLKTNMVRKLPVAAPHLFKI